MLHSLAPPDGTTKYVNQIDEGAAEDVTVLHFSWRTALRGQFDVLHLHWPELLLRARTRPKRLGKHLAMRLLLARTARRNVPVVRTVHNLAPHEAGSTVERALLRRIDDATDLFVRLNPTTEIGRDVPTVTILHGHYRERFASHPRSEPVTGRLLYFGIIRAYKGVDRLLAVFPDLADGPGGAGIGLRIVGSPSADMRTAIEAAAAGDPRISARLAFVPDAELVQEVTAAELVVLPYREMHNSGVLLVALSLDRPVLVPRTPSNSALADEVGQGWVLQYDGELTADAVRAALADVRGGGRTTRPHLDGRDWDSLGRQHSAAYRGLLSARGWS